jgi:hypothetical protein
MNMASSLLTIIYFNGLNGEKPRTREDVLLDGRLIDGIEAVIATY